MIEVKKLLKEMPEKEASDLHLRAKMPAVYRIHGKIKRATEETVNGKDMEKIVNKLLTEDQRRRFDKNKELDFGLSLKDIGRYRVNLYQERGNFALAFRLLEFEIPSFSELNLPSVIKELAEQHRGLILVTGVTGSGKSTTLASMIDHINNTRSENIITVEDPIEYIHFNKKSIIAQRQVGEDTMSYTKALEQALRQDPDVILLGEIREPETMQTALSAANTGHLVLSTLHTLNAKQTLYRILSFFPPHQHQEIRLLLSTTLQGIISQRLLPRTDQPGRVPAVEVLRNTGAIKECLTDPERTAEVVDLIAQGKTQYGMQTFDQSLMQLLNDGYISKETAINNATNQDDLRLRIEGVTDGSDKGWKEFMKDKGNE